MDFQMIGLSPICLITVSIYLKNGYESGLAAINCGFPQGSVLVPLLFLLYQCRTQSFFGHAGASTGTRTETLTKVLESALSDRQTDRQTNKSYGYN